MSHLSQQSVNEQSTTEKKPLTQAEAHERKVVLYFVIGFCAFSEIVSLVAFLLIKNVEAIIISQVFAMMFFYRILCYLYPSREANAHLLVATQTLVSFQKSRGTGCLALEISPLLLEGHLAVSAPCVS